MRSLIVLAICIAANQSVLAQTNGTPSSDGTSVSTTNQQSLKGGVQTVQLSLDELRELGTDIKNVLKAATGLYNEATIQPVSLVTMPEVIGAGTIINLPVGTQPTGPPQPIRRSELNAAMNNMRPVISKFKRNVDDFMSGERQLDLSDSAKEQLKPQFDNWVATVNDIAERESQLERISRGPYLDNARIAALCGVIQDDAKRLEGIRREIYKVIKRQNKNS
jgi:hypothetical protein